MNITLVSSIFPPEIGGPATYTYNLSNGLSRNHTVDIVAFSKSNTTIRQNNHTIHKVSTDGGMLRRQLRLFTEIYKNSEKSNLIFVQDPLVVGFASYVIAKMYRKPLIVKFVGDIPWEEYRMNSLGRLPLEEFYEQEQLSLSQRMKIYLQRLVLRSAHAVVVPSKYLKRFLVRYHDIDDRKIKVIYNGVIVNHKKQKKIPTSAVTVARLVPWKGVSGIIEVLSGQKNTSYTIIGDGPEKLRLQTLINKKSVSDRMKIVGSLPQAEVHRYLGSSEVFILNSQYEGLPHVLAEAALAKCAIVVPKLEGVCEMFDESEAAFFEPGNLKDLQKAIEIVMNNNSYRLRLAENAYKKAVNQFNWENTLKKTEKFLVQSIKV